MWCKLDSFTVIVEWLRFFYYEYLSLFGSYFGIGSSAETAIGIYEFSHSNWQKPVNDTY